MKTRLVLVTLVAATVIALSGCQTSSVVKYTDPEDPYVGWYKLPSRQDAIIPVFRIEDTYYSVCRGVEVPLRETPDGLEWALEPSSMVGTKIGVSGSGPFIIIRDRQAEHFTGETSETAFQYGQAQALKPIEEPSWFTGLTAPAPRGNDDFIGCFEPIWFPYFRLEIRKDGEKYLVTLLEIKETRQWTREDKDTELTPLPDTPGFVGPLGRDRDVLVYNKGLRRFEIIMRNVTPSVRMPLRRVSESLDQSASLPELLPIGIPTWH